MTLPVKINLHIYLSVRMSPDLTYDDFASEDKITNLYECAYVSRSDIYYDDLTRDDKFKSFCEFICLQIWHIWWLYQ